MSASVRSSEEREVAATARRYRREGYKVSRPLAQGDRPSFLGDLVPDLIAERDDDKVVIEVEQAAAVVGSNHLVELAQRVAAQPGWRFELIGLRSVSSITAPDVTRSRDEIERLLDRGQTDPALAMSCAMIEFLATQASLVGRRRANERPARALIRDLVAVGIIGEDEKDAIDRAFRKRDSLFDPTAASAPTSGEIRNLLAIAELICRELIAVA